METWIQQHKSCIFPPLFVHFTLDGKWVPQQMRVYTRFMQESRPGLRFRAGLRLQKLLDPCSLGAILLCPSQWVPVLLVLASRGAGNCLWKVKANPCSLVTALIEDAGSAWELFWSKGAAFGYTPMGYSHWKSIPLLGVGDGVFFLPSACCGTS